MHEPTGEEPGAGAAAHVFVADLDSPELDPGDAHHLTRVLRIRDGDHLTVSDGEGSWLCCRMRGTTPEPDGPVVVVARPSPAITVAFALVKGQKPELVVQKLTELGIDTIAPFIAERSVVRWDVGRAAANGIRLQRVAREASMQCRRSRLPVVAPLGTFADVAALGGAARADQGGGPLTLTTPTVLIGPEGGWSPSERLAEVPVIRLAPHVLRAETAAIAAGVVLSGLRAGLWRPPA